MRVVKHITAKESLTVPENHLLIVLPIESLGNQKTTNKGGKVIRPIVTGLPAWGSTPTDNNPKIRVSVSAMLVKPEQYAEADTKNNKSALLTL